jgi:hypothetical protein
VGTITRIKYEGEMENWAESQPPSYELPTVKQDQPSEPARIGPAGRLIGVVVSPGETFADINRKPTWLAPMLIGIAVSLLFALFYNWWARPNYDKLARLQAEQQSARLGTPAPPPETLALTAKITKISFYAGPVLAIPIVDFAVAGIFALGLLLLSANTTYKKILSVYAWSSCAISLLTVILLSAVLLVRDRETLSEVKLQDLPTLAPTNLGVLIQSSGSAVLKALATSVDLFSIWLAILLIIGFVAISGTKKITKSSTASVVVGVWVVWILIKVGIASLGFGG